MNINKLGNNFNNLYKNADNVNKRGTNVYKRGQDIHNRGSNVYKRGQDIHKRGQDVVNKDINKNLNHVVKYIQSPLVIVIFIFIVLLLLVLILRLLYNKGRLFDYTGLNKSQSNIVNDVILILSVVFVIFFIMILFFPSLKEIGRFLMKIKYSIFYIIYNFLLLYLFKMIPDNIMNDYKHIIVPFLIIFSFIIFCIYLFNSFDNLDKMKSLIYEQINVIVLFLCFINTNIIFYAVDPGKYVSSSLGYLSLIMILLGIFGFIYLIILFTVPIDLFSSMKTLYQSSHINIQNIAGFLGFLLFTLLIIIGILKYPGGFFNAKNIWSSLIIMLLLTLVFSILVIFIISNLFIDLSNIQLIYETLQKLYVFKNSLLKVFAYILCAIIVAHLIMGLEGKIGKSSILSFSLNLIITIILLIFIYKTLNPELNTKTKDDIMNSSIFKNLHLVPGLLSNNLNTLKKTLADKDSYQNFTSIFLIIVFIIVFYLFTQSKKKFFSVPFLNRNLNSKNVLLVNPIPLSMNTYLASYEDLNEYNPELDFDHLQVHNYQYAISFWFFITSDPNQSAYNEYKSLMNYGNKPEVLYRSADNSLLITMQKNGPLNQPEKPAIEEDTNINTNNDVSTLKKIEEEDDELEGIEGIHKNSRILYKREKIQLQRWNHIMLNYVNGTLDIFYNGELVKTAIELVPYMSLDSLTVGSDQGIQGDICNVVYYKNALTLDNINTIYEKAKNKNPPI